MDVTPAPRSSPYPGLTPFEEGDAAYFFGRDKDTRLIAADLFAAPLTVLYGASGVGKSSVLRAGVVPLLRQRNDVLPILFWTWQSEPLTGLKHAVADAFATERIGSERHLNYRDAVLQLEYEPLSEFLKKCATLAKRRLMIVLDQFDEFALYHPADTKFVTQFAAATRLGDLSVSFIVSLREAGLAWLDRFEGLIPTLFDNLRRIDHLGETAARAAIVEPLKKFAQESTSVQGPIEAQDTLVAKVLEQVSTGRVHVGATGRGILYPAQRGRIEAPYLQLVMRRLFNEERDAGSSIIRAATLCRLGDAQTIVRNHLDMVMDRFDPDSQDIAARVFDLLVTPSGAKIAHNVRDLADYKGVDYDKLSKVIMELAHGTDRILREVPALPEVPEERRYEIYHDRLAPAILAWRSQHLHEPERRAEKQLVNPILRILPVFAQLLQNIGEGGAPPQQEIVLPIIPAEKLIDKEMPVEYGGILKPVEYGGSTLQPVPASVIVNTPSPYELEKSELKKIGTTFAERIRQNINYGLGYSYVFEPNNIDAIAQLISLFIDVPNEEHPKTIGAMKTRLAIHFVPAQSGFGLPYCIHNAMSPEAAVCYLRIPGATRWIEWCTGDAAFDVAQGTVKMYVKNPRGDGVFRSTVYFPFYDAEHREFRERLWQKIVSVVPEARLADLAKACFGDNWSP